MVWKSVVFLSTRGTTTSQLYSWRQQGRIRVDNRPQPDTVVIYSKMLVSTAKLREALFELQSPIGIRRSCLNVAYKRYFWNSNYFRKISIFLSSTNTIFDQEAIYTRPEWLPVLKYGYFALVRATTTVFEIIRPRNTTTLHSPQCHQAPRDRIFQASSCEFFK